MRPSEVLALAEQSRAYNAANVSLVFLVDFAARVAAAEREACATLCDHYDSWGAIPRQCALAIRAQPRD